MAETIRAAREAKGLTRKEVAGLAGINDQYLYQIEAGMRHPTLEMLCALAGALGLDPHSLDPRLASTKRPKR